MPLNGPVICNSMFQVADGKISGGLLAVAILQHDKNLHDHRHRLAVRHILLQESQNTYRRSALQIRPRQMHRPTRGLK